MTLPWTIAQSPAQTQRQPSVRPRQPLHLCSPFRAVGVKVGLDDFQRVSDRVPFIADLKPSGRYVMEDVHKVGGTPAVLKYLAAKGFINTDCMTVTCE